MKPAELLDAILSAQTADGAFRSQVHFARGEAEDSNACVTGLVLRALRPLLEGALPESPLARARDRALSFLERCESRTRPGAFRFWPEDAQPAWVKRLPDDADDTAICALELSWHLRRPTGFLRDVACRVLANRTLRAVEPPSPEWMRSGVFVTWLSDESRPNVVDCCVNANIAALLAAANLRHLHGYAAACAMIEHAICWAGDSPVRAKCISPFYPHPAELLSAVEHAAACGASELRPCATRLRALAGPGETEFPDNRPVCGQPYGRIFWTSPALQRARRLAETFALQTQP